MWNIQLGVHLRRCEWKTTFKTCYGHFECVVMPFGLTNASVVFQHMMNDVFCEYLDDFVVYYKNQILIFSKNMANHELHVHLVLDKFQEVGLYAKLEKCGFHQSKVEFLSYIIMEMAFAWTLVRFKPLWLGLL